ncbi:MAG: potassium transporter [Francisellaceae bacterium]|jgi:trk system potassium uptake protein|nr:potassium transporter [Francisellaceae bacterium]MBT6207493.1 potassium transporter [Francisellaceae bacterium]MBT6538531.1 potassium transporter [Francisellaceae bacterium]
MHIKYIAKNLGGMFSIFSLTMVPPIMLSLSYKENTLMAFSISWLILFCSGLLLWLPLRFEHYEPRVREGFLIVVIYWLALCLIGGLPFFISESPDISYIDAIFESVSGLTATGATVFTQLDTLPKSIIYYRQQLQFLGGMGILLLAVAILPTLGVGGMQLFRAEITGPNKDTKLTPKLAETAKSLWFIYVMLTLLCALAYYSCGMSWFDAICYSFGTVSTGGYAPHDSSIGFFHNPEIKLVAMVFMFLGAINFSLHFFSIRHSNIASYKKNSEVKAMLLMLGISSLLIWLYMYVSPDVQTAGAIDVGFHVISLATTTGFSSGNYQSWPLFCTLLLLLLGVIGGCAGSTSGGVKIARVLILFKHSTAEIQKILHPRSHCLVKFNQSPVSADILSAVMGFLGMYIILFFIFTLGMTITGVNFITAFSAVAATLSNIGPGLGDVAYNYQELSSAAKALLSLAMITGRLELFPLLVLLSPLYWKN